MRRTFRFWSLFVLAAAGLAGLWLASACSLSPEATSNATGRLNVLVTDSPTDDWEQVTVVLKSISLRNASTRTWVEVWTADPANPLAGTVNLVDLSGVAEILTSATIPVGTYNRLKLTIDADPTTMTLVRDTEEAVDPANIVVVDPGKKGEISVDLTPAIDVVEGETANLQVDFELAHPLSIVDELGKIILNLQLRHKALPYDIRDLQFARNIGTVTAVTDTGFTMDTLRGESLTYGVDENTIWVDADTGEAGSLAGLAEGTGVLVASNMNSDGSLFARRVWYAADVDTLPSYTPEGLVRRVGSNYIKVLQKNTGTTSHHCWEWNYVTVYVNSATQWTFHETVPMGSGTSVLQYIARGFRVDVEFQNPNDHYYNRVAKTINVHSAHYEGAVTAASGADFTFGFDYRRHLTVPYSTVQDHSFSWWYFGQPFASSTSADFPDTVAAVRNAGLRVFGRAELYWANQWVAESLVLAPDRLPDPAVVTTGYTALAGSMIVTTFDWDDLTRSKVTTVFLDATGDLQTVVGSIKWNTTTQLLSTTIPIDSSLWDMLLTPSLAAVRVWVRPMKEEDGTFTWHAYTVLALTVVN